MMMAHILLRDSPAAVPWAALQQARRSSLPHSLRTPAAKNGCLPHR